MKFWLSAFGIIAILFTTGSCKKSIENNGLVGKWKLIKQYDGYVNGGNFKWNMVAAENSHALSFTQDGNYLKIDEVNGNPGICTGTYLLQTDKKLEINSTCFTTPETAFVSELNSNLLILDRSGIEGVIRYKYAATR